jgi:arginine decarboxylase
VMALISFADNEATAQRLIEAMSALVKEHADREPIELTHLADLTQLRTDTVMLPRDAMLGATEMVSWKQAAGRVAAEMICPYPPGIPVIAPGEELTPAIVDYLQLLAAEGVMVEGAADESLAQFRVVAS